MDATEKYVAELNISRFVTLVGQEDGDEKRSVLTTLLIAEVDRFGKASERLDIAEKCRGKCVDQINRSRSRLKTVPPSHPDLALAHRVLANMIEIQQVIETYISNLKEHIALFPE